jgi:tRNA dimethylallyltransferase
VTDRHTIHVIAGPTASGKSALALERANALNGVIINADSMQGYNALPILTAQPSAQDLAQAPHKLYAVHEPNEGTSAGAWNEEARAVIADVLADGKTPIIVGGSGLYIKSLMEGFSPLPEVPDEVRARVVALQEELGNPGFYEALKKIDPVMAARFHPHHTARLIRAYEVFEATGRSLAEFQAIPPNAPPADWAFDITVVMPDRATLHKRCNDRFIWMLDNGAVEEITAFDKICAQGQINEDALIHKALGARALRDWINGRMTKEEAITKAQTETRQYAKRQSTWFRNQIAPRPNILSIRHI